MCSNGAEKLSWSMNQLSVTSQPSCEGSGGVKVTCFSQVSDDVTFHYQIIRLQKQIYVWIGCNSAKFGHLYAATPTRQSDTIGVTSLIGGTNDNTGSGIARRLVLKTGLNIVLACNLPKNSPMLESTSNHMEIDLPPHLLGRCFPSAACNPLHHLLRNHARVKAKESLSLGIVMVISSLYVYLRTLKQG